VRRRGQGLFVAGFLSPALGLYLYFVVWPLVQALRLSLYRWSGMSAHATFVGLENYRTLLADPVVGVSFRNTALLVVACATFLVFAGVGLAHVVNSQGRMAAAVRSVYLYPHAVSLVVVAILWYFILSPQAGLLNNILRSLGLGAWAQPWLGQPQTALTGVGAAFCWYALGFYALLFAAGIKNLPEEVGEAASLDGSTGWHRFWRVTWPMLWSIKRVAVVYAVVNVVNIFALVVVMTRGGDPDRATETTLTYLYEQGFEVSKFGYASAIAAANLVAVLAVSTAILAWFRRSPMEARA
jgi:ABC-type sugar transport system permease subunit